MKMGDIEVSMEEYEAFRKIMNVIAGEVITRLENDKGIQARSTFYAGFSGGILGACDLEINKRFAEAISKIPMGGF